MRKWKVYLDTSVISYLEQEDAPERMAATKELWRLFCEGRYEICLSAVTLQEIMACPEPKRGKLLDYLKQIQYTDLEITEEVRVLSRKIISMGILTNKSLDDCRHIAVALVGNCDFLVSWNFKHLVNVRTVNGVRAIANLEHYKAIDIINPTSLLYEEE